MDLNKIILKVGIILIPCYTVALLTDKMVFVLRMTVVCGILAHSLVPDKKEDKTFGVEEGDKND